MSRDRSGFSVLRMLTSLASVVFVVAVAAGSSSASSERSNDCSGRCRWWVDSSSVVPLSIIKAPTPPFPVQGYDTSGSYPQVKDGNMDLRAANAALRFAVIADQREYAPRARADRKFLERAGHRPVGRWRGVYRTQILRRLVSASSVVVSVLLSADRESFLDQPGGNGWLAMTIQTRSGRRVTIRELFADPSRGLGVLGDAWRANLRRGGAGKCVDFYASHYETSATNFQQFALAPDGLTIGVNEVGFCGPLAATVPYGILRPYLSKLGAKLIAGVRPPR